MILDFIALDKLRVSKANMRHAKKPPDVSDILPTVRARGVLVPLIVRPCAGSGEDGAPLFEIVAGARRFHAARIVADEQGGTGGEIDPLPCAVLDAGDDAAAIEASLIENLARLEPDEVTQWETFTRLVREGREPEAIAATFGLADLTVRRVLALGNLLPRIRDLYRRDKIDRLTVRHLTLASKARQRDWLGLHDDPQAHAPTGQNLKSWLFGGQSIPLRHALFDTAGMDGIVTDLFGEDAWFADAEAFWAKQDAAIEERRAAYLEAGWADVVVVPRGSHFQSWEHEKAPKRKGGRVYIDVRTSGEVSFHEGYVTRKEAQRIERGEPASTPKTPRPELTSSVQTYVDLHRHAALRAAMTGHPALALRLMVAHAIAGSPLWTLRTEPQATKDDAIGESVEVSPGETLFDEKRRAVLALLRMSAEEPTVTGGHDPHGLVGLFQRLVALDDAAVLSVIAVVMGETLQAGSAAVDAVGAEIGIDMARWWQADEAFFTGLRDREVLTAMVAEVAGPRVAEANARETGKVLKQIVRDHLAGSGGREKVEGWVPRWMAFPPAAYTARGGVGSVAAHADVMAARAALDVEAQAETDAPDETNGAGTEDGDGAADVAVQQLAA
ncbi:ParB N-terminal domain-containing protein [Novosphingobium sp. G106]|uniref:ParB/RepB/Spo0J family partition protein n=1 Tax=Novosphingobium sp. G106 TaxID=2849500 RepID=UPI001C2DA827|nr:ParB N-terminal domain-containing protein [Novosphingobium sp. G106]MBV1690379.1 ParB N-terminal domain-containing protein [Novosphingobium sp. G106]